MSFKKGDILTKLEWKKLPGGSIIKVCKNCTDPSMAGNLAIITRHLIPHSGINTNTGAVIVSNGYCVTNFDFQFDCEIIRYGPK